MTTKAQDQGAPIEIRGRNAVSALGQRDDHVLLDVDTLDGPNKIEAECSIGYDGARGPNSGAQDADNLARKLDFVIRGLAPEMLLDTYSEERVHGADENILNSTRATDFLTPKSEISKVFRNAVLELARDHAFTRLLVNSGRLSVPCVYDGLSLNGPDMLDGPERTRVGAPAVDAKLGKTYLLDRLSRGITLLCIDAPTPDVREVDGVPVTPLELTARNNPFLAERYLGAATQAVYLIRLDQHVVARWPEASADDVADAVRTALGKGALWD